MTRRTPSSVSASLSRVCERGQQKEVFELIVADQSLTQLGVALRNIDEVIDHAPLGAHDQIKVA